MKNIVVRCCLALILGIALLCDVAETVVYIAITACVLALAVKFIADKRKVNIGYICMAVFFIFGGVSANRMNNMARKGAYPFVDRYAVVTGRVEEVNTGKDDYDTYVVKASSIRFRGEDIAVNDKIDVRLYKDENDTPYKYGDIICIDEELTVHSEMMNSGDMDYAAWRHTKGVFFEMSGYYSDTEYIAHSTNWWNIFDVGHLANLYAGKTIDQYFDGDMAALMHGVLLNDKSGISADTQNDIQASGLAHITTVSGMHVSILLMAMFWLLFALKLRRRYVYAMSMVFLAFYAVVLGCSPPILRAVIMAILFMIADMIGVDGDKPVAISFAAMVILLLNPMSLYDIGFQMSFLSILGITWFYEPIQRRLGKWIKIKWIRDGVACTAAVYICVMPVLILNFKYIPLYAILSNLLVSPILTAILLLGMLLLLFSTCLGFICPALAWVLKTLLLYVLATAKAIAKLPFAKMPAVGVKNVFAAIYSIAVYLLYLRTSGQWKRKGKRVAVLCGICVGMLCFLICVRFMERDIMSVTFVNVGQGDAAVVTMPDSRVMLIDGGGSAAYSDYDVGREVLVPYLQDRGIDVVDVAVVSHYDKDHVQGIVAVVELLEVKMLVLPPRLESVNEYQNALEIAAAVKGIQVVYMEAGTVMDFGCGVTATGLSPTREMLDDPTFDENDLSLVMRLSYGDMDFLFTGDIGHKTERILAEQTELGAEVIKIAHHGSDTSSDKAFIEAVSPQAAVISVGKNNVFFHPSESTLEALHEHNAAVYRTDENGDITFKVRKNGIYSIDMLRTK